MLEASTVERSIKDCIQAARAGDAESADTLCRHFAPRLHAYVTRHMGARVRRWADPEDIVQRALIETMRGLGARIFKAWKIPFLIRKRLARIREYFS